MMNRPKRNKRKTNSTDEFLHWDSLNLEDLLGDYSDNDLRLDFESEITVESSRTDGTRKKTGTDRSAKKTTASKLGYQCPVGSISFKTTTEFDKHVCREHKGQTVKAPDCDKHVNRKTSVPICGEDAFKQSFNTVLDSALQRISDDPEYKKTSSRYGNNIVQIAKSLSSEESKTKLDVLKPLFYEVACELKGTSQKMGLEREKMYAKFHQLRLNTEFLGALGDILSSVGCPERHIQTIFTQIFIEEVLLSVTMKMQVEKEVKEVIVEITENDRNVLFYICGYMLHRFIRDKNLDTATKEGFLQLVSSGKENIPEGKWTQRVSRGGLKEPTTVFYEFIYATEEMMRQTLNVDTINAKSLSREHLLVTLLNSEQVKQATENLPRSCQRLSNLRKLLSLFLTIRGFAVAKLVKRRVTKASNQKALRKSLKPARM